MTSVAQDLNKTQFSGTPGTSGPTIFAIPPPAAIAGVYVTFHLGPPVHDTSLFGAPASIPFINGALHLVWTGPRILPGGISVGGITQSAATSAQDPTPEEDEPEEKLSAAISQLTPAQQRQVKAASVIPVTKPAVVQPLAPPVR